VPRYDPDQRAALEQIDKTVVSELRHE